jgi:ATP-dependent DNA helicase PIF1
MSNSKKNNFYAVSKGHNPGIYDNWDITLENVKGFSGALYKGFDTREEAQQFITDNTPKNTPVIPSNLHLLTGEQKYVFDCLLEGSNVFLTGGGGVGKSFLISTIYTEFPGLKRQLHIKNATPGIPRIPRIQICALTGCASLLLGNKAKTLHSWAGIGLGKGTVQELFIKVRRNTKAMRNWLCTDLLIIDEISMMNGELLDKLNSLAKRLRSNTKPFGGIQVMFVGDFYQLPPVNKSDEPTQFAFETTSWKECITKTIELTQIQRQKDVEFQKVLGEARMGKLSKESCKILRGCMGREWQNNKIRPTLLFPRRAEVEMINATNLKSLIGPRHNFKASIVYDGKVPIGFDTEDPVFKKTLELFDSDAGYLVDLELAVDTQVMLIANLSPEEGLVNGSRGVISHFCPTTGLPFVEFTNGIKRLIGNHLWPIEDFEFVLRSQLPLRLAYACTIHKSQGATLDSALVDIGTSNFEFGQAYVALSRARSLDALYVYDFDPTAFKVHKRVKEFYDNLIRDKIPEEHLTDTIKIDLNNQSNSDDNKPITAITSEAISAVTAVKLQEEPIMPNNWLYERIPDSWKEHLTQLENKLAELCGKLEGKEFLPAKENIWRALELTPLKTIKVVILGQDPYPTKGNAHGLAFSVLPDVKPLPASLKNIYKELKADIGIDTPSHGNLEKWSASGIMLLNTVLTVEEGAPQSHSKIGWESVTDEIIKTIASKYTNVVFILWGKSAQVKRKLINSFVDEKKHYIYESAHPSPLSASKGFFGSKPFSKVNEWRKSISLEPINWAI